MPELGLLPMPSPHRRARAHKRSPGTHRAALDASAAIRVITGDPVEALALTCHLDHPVDDCLYLALAATVLP